MIYWDLTSATEDPRLGRDTPPADLLSPAEQEVFVGLRTPKRRRDWLLGRAAAKRLCRAWLARRGVGAPDAALTIAAGPDGAPHAALAGTGRLPVVVSISHRGELGLAALDDAPGALVGADVELCEPRPPGFTADFFAAAENAWLGELAAPARAWATTELWSLKESALKALRVGLRADTRTVVVRPGRTRAGSWSVARLDLELGEHAGGVGYVRRQGSYVISVVRVGVRSTGAPSDELRGRSGLAASRSDGEMDHEH